MANDQSADVTKRQDLSDRYDRVIEIQTMSIQNFDDKTWRTMRLTGVIAGAGLGGLSLLINQNEGIGPLSQIPVQISLSIGVLCFIGSFVLGIRSYKSSQFSTPPTIELGRKISKNPPSEKGYENQYHSKVLGSYVSAIENNRTTLKRKRNRFRQMLIPLFLGIWSLALGFLFGIWETAVQTAIVVLILGYVAGSGLSILVLYWEEIAKRVSRKREDCGC